MWTILKVFFEFVKILLLFYVFVLWPQGIWDLGSPTNNWTCTPCIRRQSLNHWTPREDPVLGPFLYTVVDISTVLYPVFDAVPNLHLWICSGVWEKYGLPWWLGEWSSACNAGNLGLIPGSGISPGEGNGSPLHYSCLENPVNRGAWRSTVQGLQRVGHNWMTFNVGEIQWFQYSCLSDIYVRNF